MGNIKPISPERAEELKQFLEQARASGQGIAIDTEKGQCAGTVPVSEEPQEGLGVIGKFNTHYAAVGPRPGWAGAWR